MTALTTPQILIYIAVMAVVTYLIRMLPLVLFRKPIESRFIKSFLYYIPYAVLGAMTFPGIFYSTGSILCAACGTAAGLIAAWFEKSLLTVALVSCGAVLAAQLIMTYIF